MSDQQPSTTSQGGEHEHQGDVSEAQDGNDPPLGRAWFRAMRAIMFEETPQPVLDSLPLAQLRLLWTVRYSSNATMKDYSERLGVSQSTVTQLADRLVRRGLVERQNDLTDRRVIRLHVSEMGSRILADDTERQRETFLAVWQAIQPVDRGAVIQALDRLAEAAEAMRKGQGKDLAAWPWRPETDSRPLEQANEGAQPVVDLMARRVRGRRSD
jgi:DNA-binding MarR family transcriptional regulator